MDPMELQKMLAQALRSQGGGAQYPDVQPGQMMGPDSSSVQASMGPVSEVSREPMGQSSIEAGMQAMRPQLADPQMRQDRASLDAGINGLRASKLPYTNDDAGALLQQLYGTRANIR